MLAIRRLVEDNPKLLKRSPVGIYAAGVAQALSGPAGFRAVANSVRVRPDARARVDGLAYGRPVITGYQRDRVDVEPGDDADVIMQLKALSSPSQIRSVRNLR